MDVAKERDIKNSLIYMSQLAVSVLLPLITLPIFTRVLTPHDYGILGLASIYAAFATGLAHFGMASTYDRNFFQYNDQSKLASKLLFSTLSFVCLNALIIGMVTFWLKKPIATFVIGDSQYGSILFWSFCSNFCNSVSYYYLTYFKNLTLAKWFAIFSICGVVVNLVFSVLFVVFWRWGVMGILMGQLIASASVFIILTVHFIFKLQYRLDSKMFFMSLKMSYPLTPTIFMKVASNNLDKFMLGLLSTVGGVGIYAIGQKIAYLIFIVMTALQNTFSPRVYQKMFESQDNKGKEIGRYLTPFVYFSIFIALLVALFAEEIMRFMVPATYHGATEVIMVLSLYYGILFYGKISPMQILYSKKTGLLSLISVLSIALTVALNVPFILYWGAVGAAWATVLSALLVGGFSFWVAQRSYKIQWEYRQMTEIYMLFVFSVAITLFCFYNIDPFWLKLVIKCVLITLFVGLGFRLKALSQENLLALKNSLFRPSNPKVRC